MITLVTHDPIDLDDNLAVVRLAMEATNTETLGDLTTYCRMRGTTPRALVEERVIQLPEDVHLPLTLGTDHTLTIQPIPWGDVDETCIVLVHDGLHDHRTPALTPDEARQLAQTLTEMADAMEAR